MSEVKSQEPYLVATNDVAFILVGVVGLVQLAAGLHLIEHLLGVILSLLRGVRVRKVSLYE